MAEVVAFITAVVVLVATVISWRTRKQVQQIHVMVNSRMSETEKRVRQLTATLDEAGIAVPPAPGPERKGPKNAGS